MTGASGNHCATQLGIFFFSFGYIFSAISCSGLPFPVLSFDEDNRNIGDFDDAVANTIYDGIVDILFEEKPVSFSGLLKRYSEEKVVTEALRRIAAHKETV
jgi:hypothetical protein